MRLNGILLIVGFVSAGISKTSASVFVCYEDSDCLDSATCKENKCECPPGDIYNSLGNKCVEVAAGYGQECTDREQCVLLTGAYTCKESKCACEEGWLYFKGKCIKYKNFGDDCSTDEECFDGMDLFARKCDNDKCKCSDGYYNRKDLDCRKERFIDETCSINLDCSFPNGACEEGICVDTKSSISQRKNLAELNSIEEEEEEEIIQRSLGTCAINSDCTLDGTFCHPVIRKCVCNRGYFLMEDKCVPELGTQCNAQEDCVGLGVDCIDGKCACTDRYQNKKGNTGCLKVPYASNFWCSVDDSCRIFGSSYSCDSEKKCVCLLGFALNADIICKPSANSGGEMCKSDKDCDEKIKNSICDPSGSCICSDEYEYNQDTAQCDALLGGGCSLSEDCKIENSVCKTKCTCADSFVQNGDKQCIPVVSELYEECEKDVQCAASFTGSYCEDGVCKCQPDHLELDGRCLRTPTGVNDVCASKVMCDALGEGLVCRNGLCQCGKDLKPSHNGQRCEMRNSGTSERVWSPMMFGGVAIAYSMIMGVFL